MGVTNPPNKPPENVGDDKNKQKQQPAEKTAGQQRDQVIQQGRAQRQDVQQEVVDQEGSAEEYVETFRRFQKTDSFDAMALYLEAGMRNGTDPNSLFNYQNWIGHPNMAEVASLFECTYFPIGRGRKAFLEGLKASETDEAAKDKFRQSNEALKRIIQILDEYFQGRQETTRDTQGGFEKRPITDWIADRLNTGLTNYNRADGMGKGAILGCAVIAVLALYHFKDDAVPLTGGKLSWSKFLMYGGALLGLNYLSGRMSADGRTLTQRLFAVGHNIDDLADNSAIKAFAEEHGMRKNQEVLRTCLRLQSKDVKRLFKLYREASALPDGSRSINPRAMGFAQDEFNGKDAFEIMDGLVKMTAQNAFLERRGLTWTEAGESQRQAARAYAKEPGRAQDEFINKYIESAKPGQLGNFNLTLFDVIYSEYRTRDIGAIVEAGRRQTGVRQVEAAAAWTGAYIRDNIARPASSFAGRKWREYTSGGGVGSEQDPGRRDRETVSAERELGRFVPPELGLEVEKPGKARILGYPLSYEIKGKSLIIKGRNFEKEFKEDDSAELKKTKAAELKLSIDHEVKALFKEKAKKIPGLADKTPGWNSPKKHWELTQINVAGYAGLRLPNGKANLAFTIEADQKTLKFFMNGKPIENLETLDEEYLAAKLQEKIWDDPRHGKYLKGLNVTNVSVGAAAGSHGPLISGKIGGLQFQAVIRQTANPWDQPECVDFYDNGRAGSVELLKIEEQNGGQDFLNAKCGQIALDPAFARAFETLESIMDNAGEGVLARLAALFPTRRFWIIPTSINISGGVNGKILQDQWKYTLDYKKLEILWNFEHSLQKGKTVKDIDQAYAEYITPAVRKLEELAADLSKIRGDQLPDHFQNFLDRLEHFNYENTDYKALFEEYQTVIRKYNYEGLETLSDVSFSAKNAHECYALLLAAWTEYTRQYAGANADPSAGSGKLGADTKESIRGAVTRKIESILQRAQQKGGGKIKLEDLKTMLAQKMPETKWGDNPAVANYAQALQRGEHERHTDEIVSPSINPEERNLDRIRGKLRDVLTQKLPLRYASRFSGETTEKYKNIIRDIADAWLMRAITENGSENELVERFTRQVDVLTDKASRTNYLDETLNYLKDFLDWIKRDMTWDLQGENPYLKDTVVKPRHKTYLANDLRRIDDYYKNRLTAEYGHWYGDKYDSEAVEFLEKVELPFYKEYAINKAIVYYKKEYLTRRHGSMPTEKAAARDLARQYSDQVREMFTACIKDPDQRRQQKEKDKTESGGRLSDQAWLDIASSIESHIKA